MSNALKNYRRSPKGVLTNMYHHMLGRHKVEFSLAKFHEKYLHDKKFIRIHAEWASKGYKKEYKPSLDRISNKLGYSFSNTHIITWAENRFKQSMERRSRKGMVAQIKNDKIIKIYKSQRDAVRATGFHQGLISHVLNGKRTHTKGFQWKYIHENPELLNDQEQG